MPKKAAVTRKKRAAVKKKVVAKKRVVKKTVKKTVKKAAPKKRKPAAKKKVAKRKPAAKKAAKKVVRKKGVRRYGAGAGEEVKEEMKKFKEGTAVSGKAGIPVESREQAIAIGLSQARKKGIKVPQKPE